MAKFWYKVLTNAWTTAEFVTEEDEECLSYLTNIRVEENDKPKD